jgi:hypothetical protein
MFINALGFQATSFDSGNDGLRANSIKFGIANLHDYEGLRHFVCLKATA